jgi:three-Cys-motif partner protein
MTEQFFQEASEQSVVKAAIVNKYFWAWAKVMLSTANRIAYIDLFAGPGRYHDGTISTPLLVLDHAIKDPKMSKSLISIFNDKDEQNAKTLDQAIKQLPGIGQLTYAPKVYNSEVDEHVVRQFEDRRVIPSLLFIDPWGYKGLSLRLINSVLKDWGCDVIVFFNYNRINMGIANPIVREHMEALFGVERVPEIQKQVAGLTPDERELTIVQALCDALAEMGGKYVLPFRFRHPKQGRTSHHLIFVSKAFRGYDIMKDIMAKASSEHEQGVASFEYNPAPSECQALLFALAQPLDNLKGLLLEQYAGQEIMFVNLYKEHSVGKPFTSKNYKNVLLLLEKERLVSVRDPQLKKRRANTLADRLILSFARK